MIPGRILLLLITSLGNFRSGGLAVKRLFYVACAVVAVMVTDAQSQPNQLEAKINQFLVRYKGAQGGSLPSATLSMERGVALSSSAGVLLVHERTIENGAQVFRADRIFTRAQAWELADKLLRVDGVAIVHPIDPEMETRRPNRPASSQAAAMAEAPRERPTPSSESISTGRTPTGKIGAEPATQGQLGSNTGSAELQSENPASRRPPGVEVRPMPGPTGRRPDANTPNIQSITIKWKRTGGLPQEQPPNVEELQRLKSAAGNGVGTFKDHWYGTMIFQFTRPMSRTEAEDIAARIRALPEIEYAIPNVPGGIHATPTGSLFGSDEWSLRSGPEPQRSSVPGQQPEAVELRTMPRRGRPDPNTPNIETISIKWKRTAPIRQAQPPTAEELRRLREVAGVDLPTFKDHWLGVIVFQLPRPLTRREADEVAARIRALPEIELAVPDGSARLHAQPRDR